MGIFNRKRDDAGSSTPANRRIPPLNPDYYASLHQAIQDYGGDDSFADVAYGIANAIENTAPKYFSALGDPRAAIRFDQRFGRHDPLDVSAADAMIDWLLDWDHASQEALEELLANLMRVLSRPPA